MPALFEPFTQRSVTLKNRIVVSPMCEYSSVDGYPNDWHLVHLGSRAVGGAGLVICEATGVAADGRISPADTGIYLEGHAGAWARITSFVKEQGSVPGMQLAHAGRKASTLSPWDGGGPAVLEAGGWSPIWSASSVPFIEGWQVPVSLDSAGMERVRSEFAAATKRSAEAGFEVVEIHAAHGYLLHQFLSPLANQREDEYGGSLENRMRFPLQVIASVREAWPERLPLWLRISATDWAEEGGWDLEQAIEFSRRAKELGVDVIDVSSGGTIARPNIPIGPGYQVPLSEAIRRAAGVATASVGMITEPQQAEAILAAGKADLVVLARELLRDPYWPRRAAKELAFDIPAPKQYGRAW